MSLPDDCQIQVEGLHKRFGSLEVLKGIDLTVRRGEVVVIMGPSGSGKTTLIRCINLLEEPDAGRVSVCDLAVPCGSGSGGRARSRRIREIRARAGMVFQQFNLFPHMTTLGNVIEGPLTVRRMPRAEAIELGERLLLDDYMPESDVRASQAIRIAASTERVYACLWTADFDHWGLTRALYALRALPMVATAPREAWRRVRVELPAASRHARRRAGGRLHLAWGAARRGARARHSGSLLACRRRNAPKQFSALP